GVDGVCDFPAVFPEPLDPLTERVEDARDLFLRDAGVARDAVRLRAVASWDEDQLRAVGAGRVVRPDLLGRDLVRAPLQEPGFEAPVAEQDRHDLPLAGRDVHAAEAVTRCP